MRLVALLLVAPCSAATFTDLGENFRDEESGIVWRKPSLTKSNRSELYEKEWIEGYRFGLDAEVRELFEHIDAEGHEHDRAYTENLQDLLGFTVFSFFGRAQGWFLLEEGPPALMGKASIDYFFDGDFSRLTTEIVATGQLTHADWAPPLENRELAENYGAWLVAVPEPGMVEQIILCIAVSWVGLYLYAKFRGME
jgi:hypothetical protein